MCVLSGESETYSSLEYSLLMSVSPSLSRRLRRVATTNRFKNILRQLGCNPESPSWFSVPISRQTLLDLAGPQFRCHPIVIEPKVVTEARAALQEIEDSLHSLVIDRGLRILSQPLLSEIADISLKSEHSEEEVWGISTMCARLASLTNPHVPARSKFWKHARRVASSAESFLMANGRKPICFHCLKELDQPTPAVCLYTHRFCCSCKKLGQWGVAVVPRE